MPGFKIIPVYINDYQLNDYVQYPDTFLADAACLGGRRFERTSSPRPQDLDLPLAAEDVTVDANANKVTVSIDYHVPVDLKVYTLQLHFTHSSENRAIYKTWLSVHLRHREARTGQGPREICAGRENSAWGTGKKYSAGRRAAGVSGGSGQPSSISMCASRGSLTPG